MSPSVSASASVSPSESVSASPSPSPSHAVGQGAGGAGGGVVASRGVYYPHPPRAPAERDQPTVIVARGTLQAPVFRGKGEAAIRNAHDANAVVYGLPQAEVSGVGTIQQTVPVADVILAFDSAQIGAVGAIVNRAEALLARAAGSPDIDGEGAIVDPYAAARSEDAMLLAAYIRAASVDDDR